MNLKRDEASEKLEILEISENLEIFQRVVEANYEVYDLKNYFSVEFEKFLIQLWEYSLSSRILEFELLILLAKFGRILSSQEKKNDEDESENENESEMEEAMN